MQRLIGISFDGIQDLTGLEFATNLTTLYLGDNDISDVSPLAGLINLTYLDLGDNDISDVSPLAGLINLTNLNLDNNSISDVSPLAGLINLEYLYLNNNSISDVSPLAGLINLTYLNLSWNDISDFSPLAGLIPNLQSYRNLHQMIVDRDAPVNIPDPNLRAAIEDALGKAPGTPIFLWDMQVLTRLRLFSKSIQDLTGLGFATNLEYLGLSNNSISDVSPLAGLINLTYLGLSNNSISDVSPLAGLINLTYLYLSGNDTSDFSPLAGLINLTHLGLSGNDISDVTPLAQLKNLKDLHLSNNDISDFSPLAGLINLTHLGLSGNDISDFSPLAGLINLTYLYLDNNSISDVSPLAGLINLTRLWLQNNPISDVSPLAGLINLTHLGLSDNDISDVSPLAGLINLTYLNLSWNDISDFSPIAGLIPNLEEYLNGNQMMVDRYTPVNIPDPNLRAAIERELGKAPGTPIMLWEIQVPTKLQIFGKSIQDLTGLEFATNLTTLYLSGNDISDFSPLAGLINLTTLHLGSNSISDVSPLAGLINLTMLYLSSNQVSDVSPLVGLINLTTLNLSSNQVSDVSPLAGLINLTNLDLDNNDISDVSPLAGLINLTTLHLGSNYISDFSPIAGLISNLERYGDDDQRSLFGACGTQMPDSSVPLKKVRVTPRIQKETIAPQDGISHGTAKFAVSAEGGRNRAWTIHDTVATNETHSRILTVEFLDGWKFRDERNSVEKAAREWVDECNIILKFVSSGRSDIRVKFDDKATGAWHVKRANVGAPLGNREQHRASNEYTMYLTTDFSYGIALHEFGHALGLIHEHLSPQFAKYFEWKGKRVVERGEQRAEFYKKIDDAYGGSLSDGDIDTNFLVLNEIDEEKSSLDLASVMTYGISNKLIKIRPNAPPQIKDVFAKHKGIPENFDNGELSDGDRDFIKECYNPPLNRATISGSVHINGLDDETGDLTKVVGCGWFCLDWGHEPINETESISSYTVTHHGEFYGEQVAVFKWGEECRVQVYVSTRKIENEEVEVAVTALLFEGTSENTNDLEDIVCRDVTLPLNGKEQSVFIRLDNTSAWGAGEIDARTRACNGTVIYYNEGGLRGDLGGSGDWAEVTVTLNATRVDSSTYVAAAPSAITTSHTSSSETAAHDPALDVNRDGQINVADLVLVSNHLGQPDPVIPPVDVNSDGSVTIVDLVQVAQHLGESTVSPAPAPVAVPADLTYEAVQGWIDHARAADDGSLVFRQGIANLESLLASLIPAKTVLLPNYPNPFNPETWIPYHLSEPADVTLNIYSVDGKVVRHLELGHQAAGFYQSRSRAAYWDGRNAGGEQVASGVFFYTLTAGDFSAIRKMVILK